MKKPTRKTWIRLMDKLVSQIVIKRDKQCVVCKSGHQLTAGHLFSRSHLATRWHLENVNCQCLSCNLKHVRDQYPYISWFINKHGAQRLEEVRSEHYQITHYKTHDLENIYEGLKEIYSNL